MDFDNGNEINSAIVLVVNSKTTPLADSACSGYFNTVYKTWETEIEPTHWMPIPPLPKAEVQDEEV